MTELKTALIIDDDDDIRIVGAMCLQKIGGLQVHTASSGFEGVELAEAHQPDVILLDMMMPGLDGLGTLAELRARPETEHIPVIFMTAKAQARDLPQYLAAGALEVIPKPFDPMSLTSDVRSHLEQAAAAWTHCEDLDTR